MLSELNVSKSPGPDGIYPRFINELTEQLCLPLSIIFTESMKTSIIPKQWKLARVSAIHKKGSYKKLKAYKFNAELLYWVQSYLKHRSQFVEVNGKQSLWLPVTSGIPLGGVLSPLLFLLYINDLPDNIHVDSSVYMYADDTKLFRDIREPRDHEILQEDLNKISDWSDLWLLNFHPEKCFSLTIGKQDEHQFTYHMMIDKTKIFMTKVEDIKDIRVTIDCQLKFEST